jgi:hypothetical protein
MTRHKFAGLACLAFALWANAAGASGSASGPSPRVAERVETLDLRAVEGNVVAVSADKVEIVVAGKPRSLPLADVESVQLGAPDDLASRAGMPVVRTVAGDLVAAETVTARDGNLRCTNPLLGEVVLPLASVAWVYLPAQGQTLGALLKKSADVKPPEKSADMLIVDQGKEWAGVDGVLVAIDGDKITFRLGDEDRQVEERFVRAIRLAAPAATETPAGRLVCSDGSEVLFKRATLAGETLTIQSLWGGELKISRKHAAGITFFSARSTDIAALPEPEATEYGFFDTKFPHRMNRAVDGGPIRLGGRVHAGGVGMNSFTSLTWKLDGQYKTFVAVAGIDDAIRPLGNAALTFLADGKELDKPLALDGKDAPREIRLDVAGVKAFTVRVDFGADRLPVGDHVDLGSARFLK